MLVSLTYSPLLGVGVCIVPVPVLISSSYLPALSVSPELLICVDIYLISDLRFSFYLSCWYLLNSLMFLVGIYSIRRYLSGFRLNWC